MIVFRVGLVLLGLFQFTHGTLFKFTFKMAFLECFQTVFLSQAEQSVTLHTRERCRTVNISSRHRTYSIKVKKLTEPDDSFQHDVYYVHVMSSVLK